MFLRSVRIDYLIEDRVEYYFLSEFFRFAGFWVVSCICGEDEIRTKCESAIYISGIQEASAINFKEIKSQKKNPVERLVSVLNRMGYTDTELCFLARVYITNSLMLHGKNIDFSISTEWSKKASSAFREVYNELNASDMKGMYIEYAKKYCQAQANLALFNIDGSVCYPITTIKSELKQLEKKYPEYINLHILSCLFYYADIDFPKGSVNLCKYEIMEETSICIPELRRWIANVFDAMEDDPFAEFYYVLSIDEKPNADTFRSLINFLILRDSYDEALEYLEQLISFLDRRIRHKFATPKELDCYFWAHFKLAEIYYADVKDCWMAIRYGEYIRICYQELIDSNRFYDDFYGNQADEARNSTILQFYFTSVQKILEGSYQELGMRDGAENG